MKFHFVSAFGSGQVVERQTFDSATFDRNEMARYVDRINQGEAFAVDLGDIRLDYHPLGPKLASVEVLSPTSFIIVHLLGSTDPAGAKDEINKAFSLIHDLDASTAEEAVGEVARIDARPLVLALLPEGEEEARNLARYPVALAAAFFEACC
jgi:hypothetical protein